MKRIILALPLTAVLAVLVLAMSPRPALAATYVVDTTSDVSLTACTAAAGDCSLRGAINNANASGATVDTITFSASVFPTGAPATITIASGLSLAAGAATTVDGSGAGVIVDGAGEPSAFNCFTLDGPHTIRDIQVTDCTIGIQVSAASATVGPNNVLFDNGTGVRLSSSSGVVKGNKIGTNAAGTAANPAGGNTQGVAVAGTANTVGGSTVADRNIVSANTGTAIGVVGATGAVIKGNYIGTDVNGTLDLGNGSIGVYVETSTGTNIGGAAAGERNIISGNSSDGIRIDTGTSTTIVRGNYIGLASDGSTIVANTGDGIDISLGGAATIGGSAAGDGNVISGNTGSGVVLATTNAPSTVAGNIIGLDATGTLDKSNGTHGVYITDSAGNTIGGVNAGDRNVISGHGAAGAAGIRVQNVGNQAFIRGNYIGTDITGTASVPNTDGININNSFFIEVGGTTAGSRNVISGNIDDGIEIAGGATDNTVRGNYIGVDATGAADLGNGANGIQVYGAANFNTIGGSTASARNIISGNNGTAGIRLSAVSGITVSGNYIGLNAAGTAAIPNDVGVQVSGSTTTIGGQAAGERNVISGNLDNGVEILAGTGNSVLGNIIGLDAAGTTDRGNAGSGVLVTASNTTIGDDVTAGDGNVISGNDVHGIEITGTTTTGTSIEVNYIGTDITGTLDRGNTLDGIHIDASDGNTIGGSTTSSRNIISGNNSDGIELANDANGNTVKNNYIGTDITGTLDRGNSAIGINIVSSDNNIVGAANEGNLSSGNNQDGVEIASASTGNLLQGNILGLAADNVSPLGNGTNGIQILGSSSNNTVGGDLNTLVNHIAFNGGDGITVSSGTGNLLARNSIHDNAALGIDLANDNIVTPNDLDDPDTGANNLQNFPVLTSASSLTTITNVVGTLNSTPSTTFTLRFYYSSSCDTSGNGEGQTYLASINQTTNVSGDVGFSINFGQATPNLSWITVTATDPSNNTSEFSNCVQVPALIVDTTSDSNLTACTTAASDCSLRGAINNANAATDPDIIHFSIGAGGAQTIAPSSALPTITQPLTIDGTTQPGFAGAPLIELNGTSAGASIDGLNITGGSSTIRGLVINRFGGDGIELGSASNLVAGNYIGTSSAGTADQGNAANGVRITGSSNVLGGTVAADRNVISGNNQYGIEITSTAASNLIAGNYIGTNVSGTAALGNSSRGLWITGPNNTIGSTSAGGRNVISGNAETGSTVGLSLFGASATGNTIWGNYIGVDASGSTALPNGSGIQTSNGAAGNTFGGSTAGARNIISGNQGNGVSLGSPDNAVLGNYIGTNAAGTGDLGNGGYGIISSAPNNTIGGTTAGARNLISGNTLTGLRITGATTSGNQVLGNYIGTDATGTVDLGNDGDGVSITSDASNNIVGGTSASARNVISGNNGWGVSIGSSADNNTVSGNFIGTNAAGTGALGNTSGMSLVGSVVGNIIGGAAPGAGNVISGNTFLGISIGNGAGSTTIAGNYIGTDLGGTLNLGNGSDGISITGGSASNLIGSGAPNVIAFNGDAGLRLDAQAGTGNRIGSNRIDANGGLGIDLGGTGVTPNDLGDGDAGPNNLQNFPVLVLASTAPGSQTIVRGYLNSAPSTMYTVNFFRNASCDPSGNGEGETSMESASVTTDAFGFAQFALLLDAASAQGQFITATATDPSNNTSEFSACRTVTSDFDGDGDADSADNCPAWPNPTQALPAWTVPANDFDCDGFNTANEAYIGTNPADQCGAAAWPPDFNDSGSVSVTDVLALKPAFGLTVPPASPRFDIKVSGSVSVSDVLELKPYFNKACS